MMAYIIRKVRPENIALKEALELVRGARRSAVPSPSQAALLKKYYASLVTPGDDPKAEIAVPQDTAVHVPDVPEAGLSDGPVFEEGVPTSTDEMHATGDGDELQGPTTYTELPNEHDAADVEGDPVEVIMVD